MFVADLAGPITTISLWCERAGNDLVAFRTENTKYVLNNHEFGYILMISHVIHKVYAVHFEEVTEMKFHHVLPNQSWPGQCFTCSDSKGSCSSARALAEKKEVHVNGSGEVSTGSEADTSCCFDIHFSLVLPTY